METLMKAEAAAWQELLDCDERLQVAVAAYVACGRNRESDAIRVAAVRDRNTAWDRWVTIDTLLAARRAAERREPQTIGAMA